LLLSAENEQRGHLKNLLYVTSHANNSNGGGSIEGTVAGGKKKTIQFNDRGSQMTLLYDDINSNVWIDTLLLQQHPSIHPMWHILS
jgi:hypothetical protein